MPLTFTNDQRDQVASIVYGDLYANCDALQKAMVDDCGRQAISVVEQFAETIANEGDGDNAPSEWEHFLIWEAAAAAAIHGRPDDIRTIRDQRERCLDVALRTYHPTAIDDTAELQAYSLLNIRRYCMGKAARREKRVFLNVHDIDTAMQSVIHKTWNRARWHFRKRLVKMSIESDDGSVTFYVRSANTWTAYTGSFDSLSSRMLYSSSAASGSFDAFWTNGNDRLRYVNADTLASATAYDDDKTGKPTAFRLEGSGSSATWRFWPYPDQDYDFYAEILSEGPTTTIDAASDTDVFGEFPADFRPIMRDAVYAKCLLDEGVEDGRSLWADYEDQIEEFIPRYEEIGGPTTTLRVRDTMGDAYELGLGLDEGI